MKVLKTFLLLLISFLVGAGLFFWILRTVGWQGIKDAFLIFTGWHGLVILVLTLLIMMIRNLIWQEVLKAKEVEMSFWELFKIYLAGFSIRFLAPVITLGDEFFQTYVIKEKKAVPWSKGMATVLIERALEWMANLTVIFLGGLVFLFLIGFPILRLGIVFVGVFLIILIVLYLFYVKVVKKESLVGFFIRNNNQPFEIEKEIFGFFKTRGKAFWKAVSLSFFRVILTYLRVWFLILFLGKNINPLVAFSVLGFNYLAVIIPIPTSLGTHEAIQTFVFKSLGLGVFAATAYTMIIRGVELIVSLFGIVFFFRLGIALIKSTLFKKIDKISGINV